MLRLAVLNIINWQTDTIVNTVPSDRSDNLRNIGIVAHVDAGKTTLAEQMLYLSGRIRATGSVDAGTSQLDWLDTEKQRGITILAATTAFAWKGCHVNLIDTPGHADFSSETQRALRILDGVIVVVSAVEGVQAHTLTLWRAIQSLGIPTIFFINKMDQRGADAQAALEDIRVKLIVPERRQQVGALGLSNNAVLLQSPSDVGDAFTHVRSIFDDAVTTESCPHFIEKLADADEEVLEAFVEERMMDNDWLICRLRNQVQRGNIQPVLMGAAIKQIGVEALLDTVVELFPAPQIAQGSGLSAVVFKVQREPRMGRMAFVRLYSGQIVNRQSVENTSQDISEKVSQIRKVHANSYEDVGQVAAGDIAALCGLQQTRIGDILGLRQSIPDMPPMPVPVFQVKAFPADGNADFVQLAEAMAELEDEDPNLVVGWNPGIRELHVRVMGMVQVEVLQSVLQDRFGLRAEFGKPGVVFKETPVASGHGYVAYTSIPHWAVLRFLIEPGTRGSGLEYKSIVRPGELKIRYQREVARRVPLALQHGPKGWQVSDLRVTLIEGSDHEQHTHPLDFVAATGWAIEDGLDNCGTRLLEPILAFEINAPAGAGGRICSELFNRRAQFDAPVFNETTFFLEGEAPAATILDFPILLGQWSGGKAAMTTHLVRYELAPDTYNEDTANFQPKSEGVSFRTYM